MGVQDIVQVDRCPASLVWSCPEMREIAPENSSRLASYSEEKEGHQQERWKDSEKKEMESRNLKEEDLHNYSK